MLNNQEVAQELDYISEQRGVENIRVKQALLILRGALIGSDEMLEELVGDMLMFAKRQIARHSDN